MKNLLRWPVVVAFLFPFLGGCGGGGGSTNTGAPSEIVYVMAENTNNSNVGSIFQYGLNPSTGQFQAGTTLSLPTGGNTPLNLLFSPGNSLAFALNNSASSGSTGSLSSFTVSPSNGLAAVSNGISTNGSNPVDMAVDPGGTYLVVANHGTSSGGNGNVAVFTYTSGGALSPDGSSSTGSPCAKPFRVVFSPNAIGNQNDSVFVVCSTPESLPNSSPVSIYSCSVGQLLSGGCSSPIYASSGITALLNFQVDPSGAFAVGPGTTYSSGSYSGFLLICPIVSGGISSCSPTTITNISIPSGNVAFLENSSGKTVFIGNYNPATSSFNNDFASCSLSNDSCSPYTVGSPSDGNGPITFALNSAGTGLFIAATVTPIDNSSFNTSSGTGSGPPSTGSLFSCSVSNLNSCNNASPQTTGGWPVGITQDNNGRLFVPDLSGQVDIFSGTSSGNLSPFQTLSLPSGTIPISVAIP